MAAEESVKIINPIVVRTENVAKELMAAAASNEVPVTSLDFNLLDVQTSCRTAEAGKEAEWEEMTGDELHNLDKESALLNGEFQLKQVYEIEIHTKTEAHPFDNFDVSIGANSIKTKIYLTVKPGSNVTYYDDFEKELHALVNKKMLRANLMIYLFDEPMKESLGKLVARARVNEAISFDKKELFLVAQGIDPVPTINDKLVLSYEEKGSNEAGGGRVDYSKRGYMISAVEDEVIIEYVKPKQGEPGRNCRGEYLPPKEPVVKHEPTFTITDKIGVEESDEKIEYRAKQSGYVVFENNQYDISTEMDVTEISFKSTGSIDTELDADVSINVRESDAMKDAIGQGMEVEVHEINVDGNVGPNAKVIAKRAAIEGQTHQSSIVEADDLKINIHRGTASGKNVTITRLEHGTVEADKVTIKQAAGGKIRAREIHIELLGSHVSMSAIEKIEIEKMNGSENHFRISPVVMSGAKEDLSANEEKVLELKRAIASIKAEVEKNEEILHQNRKSYEDMKQRMLQYKKSGVKMPSAFVKKYKQYQEHQKHLDELKSELQQKEERFELLSAKHHAFQGDIMKSRIINKGQWVGHNEVVYELIEPDIEVSYVPRENSEDHVLALRRDDETGAYYIEAVDK